MTPLKLPSGEYLLMEGIRKDADKFVCDMGYLIYRQPAYENWVTNKELENWGKLEKYIERTAGKEQYRTTGKPLPPGNWQFIGRISELEKTLHDWAEICEANKVETKTTILLKKKV